MQRAWLAVALIAVGCHRAGDDGSRVVVTARWPGASAEAMDAMVAQPLEDAVGHAEGVARVVARAQPGVVQIIVERGRGVDAAQVVVAVRAKVAAALTSLPRDLPLSPTVVERRAGLHRAFLVAPLTDHAPMRELVRAVERTRGVASVEPCGDPDPGVTVWVDPARAAAVGLDAVDVADALAKANVNVPAGRIDGTRLSYTINVGDAPGSLDALGAALIAERDGAPVYVRDVATVTRGGEPRCIATTTTGATAVAEVRADLTRDAREGLAGTQLTLVDGPLYAIAHWVPPGQTPGGMRAIALGEAMRARAVPGVAWAVARVDLETDPRHVHLDVALAPGADAKAVLAAVADDHAGGNFADRVDGAEEYEAVLPDEPGAGTSVQAAWRALRAKGIVASCEACEEAPDLALDVDRARAADLGIAADRLARTLRIALGGDVVGTLYTQTDSYAIRVAVAPRPGVAPLVAAVADLLVRGPQGLVPLSSVVRTESRTAPTEIRRENGRRVLLVWARGEGARAALAAALPGAELRARHAVDD